LIGCWARCLVTAVVALAWPQGRGIAVPVAAAAQRGSADVVLSIAVPPSLLPGALARVTVTAPAGSTAVTAQAFGEPVHLLRAAATRWEGLLGVDLDQKPGSYPVTASAIGAAGARVSAHASVVVTVRRYATRTLSVSGRFVDPTPAELQRIQAEAAHLAAVYSGVSERQWTAPFITPVHGQATGNFGARSVFNGQPRAPHAGIDYRGAVGTAVVAPGAGQVVLAENLFFTGNTVILDHGLGLFSLYAHLSRMDVGVGQSVTGGAPLGLVGATGRVTGPHLHWALRLGRARIDPALALQILSR
jgi:hypothetical protein